MRFFGCDPITKSFRSVLASVLVALTVCVHFEFVQAQNETQSETQSSQNEMPAKDVSIDRQTLQNPAYIEYARSIVEIYFTSNKQIAALGLSVVVQPPGHLAVKGDIPDHKMRDYVINAAQKLSRLKVEDHLSTRKATTPIELEVTAQELQTKADESLKAFFPNVAHRMRVICNSEDMSLTIQGVAQDLDTKVQIGRLLKSQPGCSAVSNLLVADSDSTHLVVNQMRNLRLPLDSIPPMELPAPFRKQAVAGIDQKKIERTSPTMQADDIPDKELINLQIQDQIRERCKLIPELEQSYSDVRIRGRKVAIQSNLKDEKLIQQMVEIVESIKSIRYVEVYGDKQSHVRNIVSKRSKSPKPDEKAEKQNKLAKIFPFLSSGSDDPIESHSARRTIEKKIRSSCQNKFSDFSTEVTVEDRLQFNFQVDSTNDRDFIVDEITHMIEVRDLPYDIVIKQS